MVVPRAVRVPGDDGARYGIAGYFQLFGAKHRGRYIRGRSSVGYLDPLTRRIADIGSRGG